jgi:hypothetical protein
MVGINSCHADRIDISGLPTPDGLVIEGKQIVGDLDHAPTYSKIPHRDAAKYSCFSCTSDAYASRCISIRSNNILNSACAVDGQAGELKHLRAGGRDVRDARAPDAWPSVLPQGKMGGMAFELTDQIERHLTGDRSPG